MTGRTFRKLEKENKLACSSSSTCPKPGTPHHPAHLVWGSTLSTNRKMAFSGGSWMRLLMIYMNWATEMSEGNKYFLLSMSTICDLGTFSTITCATTHRSDYNPHSIKHTAAVHGAVTYRNPVWVLVAYFG